MQTQNRLKIALQKKGRLSQDCAVLLKQSGVKINWNEQRLIAYSENLPIEILRVRDDDIPGLIFDGVVDLGINGVQTLANQRIATSYPHLLRRYMQQQGVPFKNCLLNGSVEVAPSAGLAAAICEIRPQTGRQRYDLAQCKRITAFTEFSTFR